MWRPDQMLRLAQERKLLIQEMPDFSIGDPTGRTYVFGRWVSNGGVGYGIRIDIPPGYPDECPKTYIEQPRPLRDYHGKPMTRHGTSHVFHTWSTDRRGSVQICTYRPEYWDSSSTLIQLIHKAFLWITAFEVHRRNGTMINDVLLDM